jgi:hypothetical protein
LINILQDLKLEFKIPGPFLCGDLEFKKLYPNNRSYDCLSPKIGLSRMDIFNLEYAFNIIDKNKDFEINSIHRISINISFIKKQEVYRIF